MENSKNNFHIIKNQEKFPLNPNDISKIISKKRTHGDMNIYSNMLKDKKVNENEEKSNNILNKFDGLSLTKKFKISYNKSFDKFNSDKNKQNHNFKNLPSINYDENFNSINGNEKISQNSFIKIGLNNRFSPNEKSNSLNRNKNDDLNTINFESNEDNKNLINDERNFTINKLINNKNFSLKNVEDFQNFNLNYLNEFKLNTEEKNIFNENLDIKINSNVEKLEIINKLDSMDVDTDLIYSLYVSNDKNPLNYDSSLEKKFVEKNYTEKNKGILNLFLYGNNNN